MNLAQIRRVGALLVAGLLASGSAGAARGQNDNVLAGLWETNDADRRAAIAADLAGRLGFDEAWAAARERPANAASPPTGRILESHEIDGQTHPYMLLVPDNYDPSRSYGVRVYLHGGVARGGVPDDGGWWRRPERLARDDSIAVFPAAWNGSQWWQRSQLASLVGILDHLKSRYRVDTNRVSLFGISDGGTGAWYVAFLDPTPWAAFVPLIGHPAVLANPRLVNDAQLHVANLANRPFLAINGEVDRLYPARSVEPYLELFQGAGAAVEFITRAGEDHTVRWWPDEAERIERFLQENPRDPLPDRLVWETADPVRTGRLHWLVIDELGAMPDDAAMPPIEKAIDVGGRQRFIGFPTAQASGRIEAVARGNHIEVRSRGVRSFRLLLSPDQFDLSRPVTVRANGRTRFEGPVRPSAGVLLRWLARDLDPAMLFGAEVVVRLLEGVADDRPPSDGR